ncbi:hypothetical protein KAR50_06490 [Periweissella fabaria]|uniref:Phospholipase D-like domain-containing protein n=1 Tax=Periweissella fabaria TaxID=546157 RepID=A0ABN8BE01_9LACO|nr:hypothetical protein [Periweissella fabaria]MCM0597490.1 hypothetical protein [Periweissella fabaria]CAH0416008.1 hypothetical protein WFA24289_00307 [Periweissella fabaria]
MNNYVIQALIKSQMSPGYMANYINAIINMYCNNTKNNINIHIWGACWGKVISNGTSVKDLVNEVFHNVPKNKVTIVLNDYYPGSTSKDILNELQYRGYSTSIGTNVRNHSKIIHIFENEEVNFLMVGSSNFSANTYLRGRTFIDQTDIAFIKATPESSNIVGSIINAPGSSMLGTNQLLYSWATEAIDRNIDNIDSDPYWTSYINSNPLIINTPYQSKEDIIKTLLNELTPINLSGVLSD